MKFPIGRTVATVVLFLMYAIALSIWTRALSQYQAIAAAAQINDDGVWTNAVSFWFRNNDLIGGIATLVFVVVIAMMWKPFVEKLFSQES